MDALRRLTSLASCALLAGCASVAPMRSADQQNETVSLDWIGRTVVPFEDDMLGGLSGLAYDDGRWFAVTDHPREPRLVELAIDLDPAAQRVDARVVRWDALPPGVADAESIERLLDGSFIVGSEAPGAISRIDHELARADPLPVPQFVGQGLRFNRRFEALAIRENELWVGIETALEQDGPESSIGGGARCRVLVYDASMLRPLRQHVYETERAPGLLPGGSFNSLVGFAALDDGRFLALERSLEALGGYTITLRLITPELGETDVSSIESLRDAALTPLHVETIARFSGLGEYGPGNVEGIALGPALRDAAGGRLVVLVSDDNFGREGARGSLVIALRLRVDGPTSADAGRGSAARR